MKIDYNNYEEDKMKQKELSMMSAKEYQLLMEGTKEKTPKRKKQPEYDIQRQVCAYIRASYPSVLFDSDTIAAVRLSIPQQARNKKIQKEGFKRPDIVLYEARQGYHSIALELKVESPFLKDGVTLKKSDHLKAQSKTISDLRDRGYCAMFVVGFDEAKRIIDWYMGNE